MYKLLFKDFLESEADKEKYRYYWHITIDTALHGRPLNILDRFVNKGAAF